MKGLFRSKVTLILVYILMAAVCVYLNYTSERMDLANIIVSAVMFVIVLAIFLFAVGRFARIDAMIRDLNDAANQIRNDYRVAGNYLWDSYGRKEVLFTNKILSRRYAEFHDEMERLRALSGDVYHCDIEDYINQDLIDDSISRNVLNLVSGTMTGLGILGTFIGLSLGLQQFNTGTADEIASSIGPLIQGIKVAFHTSIYGMVFSLVFSFIYKNKLDQAYEALDRFLDAYENFVLPDSRNESLRQLLSFEQKQAEGMAEIAGTFAEEVSKSITAIMKPQFEEMNRTITSFARVASESQVAGLERVTDKFIEQMNRSLGGTLGALGGAIRETVEWQQQDRTYMRNILNEIGGMASDAAKQNELAEQALKGMAGYVTRLDRFQGCINEDLAAVQKLIGESGELTKQQTLHAQNLDAYEKQIAKQMEEISSSVRAQMDAIRKAEAEFTAAAARNVDALSESVGLAGQKVIDIAESAAGTIAGYSENAAKTLAASSESTAQALAGYTESTAQTLAGYTESAAGSLARNAELQLRQSADITNAAADSMNKAAALMSEAAEQLGEQFSGAYDAIGETHSQMQEELQALVYALEVLRQSVAAISRGQEA